MVSEHIKDSKFEHLENKGLEKRNSQTLCLKLQVAAMVFGLRVEDRLDGAANFSPWKARISLILEENEPWDIVHSTTANPIVVHDDVVDKETFMKRDVRARRVILDAVKDHVIPHISAKSMHFRCGHL